ncbi:MAG: hypothetical protein WBW55_03040 [Desulfobaccales bacterium]
MSLETAENLSPEVERPGSFHGNPRENDRDGYCQSIQCWDEIVRRWPKERFPSLFSMDHRA